MSSRAVCFGVRFRLLIPVPGRSTPPYANHRPQWFILGGYVYRIVLGSTAGYLLCHGRADSIWLARLSSRSSRP